MANEIKRYTLDISNVTENGVACDNPTVTILSTTSNVAVNCINGCEYEVSSLENLQDQCITFLVECEDCGSCPAEEITVCFCSDDNDCGACENCTDGICVSRCPDQFCKNGVCVECDSDADCPPGYICTIEGCVCPSGIISSDGRCLECDASTPLDNCQVCVDGQIVTKDCGTFNCNPKTGECQECVDNSHCSENTDGRTCCKNGKCSCCEGYQYDEVLQRCVEIPPCVDSEDCGPCKDCNGGVCVPRECPDDYACNPETDQCEYNPCPNQPCNNGAECGPDCGCGQDGFCAPCSELSCSNNDCANTLGCGCVGSECEAVSGCSGSCQNGYDCGPGCTCYQGQCVSCENFSCADGDCDNRAGCECIKGKCKGGGPGTGTGQNACTDEFELVKDSTACNLTANLKLNKACQCPTISAAIIPTVSDIGDVYRTTITVNLHKGAGDINSLPRLGDTTSTAIADNEKPTSGTIAFDLITTRAIMDNGVKVGEEETKLENVGGALGFAGIDTNTTNSFDIDAIGSTNASGNVVIKHVLVVRSGAFEFPNTCSYDGNSNIMQYTITTNSWGQEAKGEIVTDDTRVPRFIWYRSEDNVFGNNEVIRDLYITSNAGGFFSDTLFGPDNYSPGSKQVLGSDEGLLIPNRYYQVFNDCSCNPIVASDLMFFCASDITNLEEPTLSNCGRKMTLVGNPQVCNVNQNLSQFNDQDGSPYSEDLSVTWNLYVNDNLITTFRHDGSSQLKTIENLDSADSAVGISFNGYNYTNTEAITSIRIEQDNGNCKKEFEFDSVDLIPEIVTSCDESTGYIQAKFLISGYTDGNTLQEVTIFDGGAFKTSTTDGTYIIFSDLASDRGYTYNATFSGGCTYTDEIKDTCCTDDLFEVVENCNTDGTATVTITVNQPGVEVTVNNGFQSFLPNGQGQYILSNDRYTITGRLTSSENCVQEEIIRVNCCEAGTIAIDSITTTPYCDDDGTEVVVTGTPGVTFNLGYVTLSGTVEVCNPIATNQTISGSGVATVSIPSGLYDSLTGGTGARDITFKICSVNNSGADCDVTIETASVNSVVYPGIDITSESTACNSEATEYSLTIISTNTESAALTLGTGNLSFSNGTTTVTNIPSGTGVRVTLTGTAGVCSKLVNKTITCDCAQPVAPNMTPAIATYCEGDANPTFTATNPPAGAALQVSTNGTDWTTLAGFTYDAPAGTYYFRYIVSNCPGPSTTRVVQLNQLPTILSTEFLDNCSKVRLTLSGVHDSNATVTLHNSSDCSAPSFSLANPSGAGTSVVTYTIPAAALPIDQTNWSVSYGDCSCETVDAVSAGCGVTCNCDIDLFEAPQNCNLELTLTDSGTGNVDCENFNQIVVKDSSGTDVYTFTGALDSDHDIVIGPDGTDTPLIPLVDGEIYTATLSSAIGCPDKVSVHTLECADCNPTPEFSYGGSCDAEPTCSVIGADVTLWGTGCQGCVDSQYLIDVSGVAASEFTSASIHYVNSSRCCGMDVSSSDVTITASSESSITLSLNSSDGIDASCESLHIIVEYTTCDDVVHTFTVLWLGCGACGC